MVLVYSKALDTNTDVVVSTLKKKLGHFFVGKKAGIHAHSPYQDVLEITSLLNERQANGLLSMGSSSYSGACKIGRLVQTNPNPENLTPKAIEAFIIQAKGTVDNLIGPCTYHSPHLFVNVPVKDRRVHLCWSHAPALHSQWAIKAYKR